jgi:hypothetical protein
MSKPKSFAKIQHNTLRRPVFAIALLCAFAMGNLPRAQAQTFSVIHTFTGGSDGWWPYAGLTIDQGGNLYGTTSEFSSGYTGTAFEMRLRNGFWTFTTLSDFSGPAIRCAGAAGKTDCGTGRSALRHDPLRR